jgi:hypothetical protein
MSRAAAFVLILFATLSTSSQGQVGGPCPTSNSTHQTIASVSSDLICVVPQVYGPGGLVGTPNNGPLGSTENSASFPHAVHFQAAALASFTPLTADIGTQLSQLPITSPASGFIFSFNPTLGVISETTHNFGPILTERPQTIGRHKLFVGFSYQYFNFDKADGINLRSFGGVFHHEFEACPGPPVTCYNNNGTSVPVITKDFVSTQNRIDLRVNQFVAVGTFGLMNRLDLSVAIPILNVRHDMTSDATIQNIETTDSTKSIFPPCCVHIFSPTPLPGETLFPEIAAANGFTYHDRALFRRTGSSSGIGDVVFRGKFEALKRERVSLATALDVRVPTGDDLNFLGSGTWGVRPFVAFAYTGRVSPHANVGLQVNGNSVLAGDVTANTKAHLPNVVNYSAGVDVGVTTRLSLSADFLGLTLHNARKIVNAPSVLDFNGGSHADIGSRTATVNQASIAVGGKWSPFYRLIITANVLFSANDAGLHHKPAPLIGVSHTF